MNQPFVNELVPCFVKRLLRIGAGLDQVAAGCSGGLTEVMTQDRVEFISSRYDEKYFDCILIDTAHDNGIRLFDAVRELRPYLNPDGVMGVILPDGMGSDDFTDRLDAHLNGIGLLRYRLLIEDNADPDSRLQAILMVGSRYNPVAHARRLASAGDFGCGIQIINGIPHDLLKNHRNLALIAAEKQRLYLEWQKSMPPDAPPHMLFFRARKEFADVTSALPQNHAAYRTEADFWQHIGNDNMAVRTLRSILSIDFDAGTAAKLQRFDQRACVSTPEPIAPEWSRTRRPPRLLVMTHDFSDYGLDCLYDGLCRVLGNENVIEFPWKPMLHGRNLKDVHNYPCSFNHPAERPAFEDILHRIKDSEFDLIVYADVVQMAYPEEVARVMQAGRNLPVVLYDTYDNCYTPWNKILKYTRRKGFDLYFKREMLAGVDYGPGAVPLPFGYPAGLIADTGTAERSHPVFWAGKRVWGLRPVYIPKIEQMLNQKFDKSYSQAEYQTLLQASRIGLSFFGSGFDTVRYWEIPAHGAMLLAERPPIRIPHNFTDGRTAVFFDDIVELEEKLTYYLNHPAMAAEIADAGHEHVKRYHTSTARAKQFLGHVERCLCW